MSLAKEGVEVTIVARTRENIEKAAAKIQEETHTKIQAIAADITTHEGQEEVLRITPNPDILVNNAGGPPPGDDFRLWQDEDWLNAVKGNMLAPINMIKKTVDYMIANNFGRIVNITSSSVKLPIANLGLSNGARSGLTGFIAGLARDKKLVRRNVTINNLLPGNFNYTAHHWNS